MGMQLLGILRRISKHNPPSARHIVTIKTLSNARVFWFSAYFPSMDVLSGFVASGDLRPLFPAFGEIAQSRLDIIACR